MAAAAREAAAEVGDDTSAAGVVGAGAAKKIERGGILGALGANPQVLVVCFAAFCVMYAFNVMQVSYAVMMSDRFGWGSVHLGGILVACGIVGALVQAKYVFSPFSFLFPFSFSSPQFMFSLSQF